MPALIENTEDWTPGDQRQKISELDDNVVVCFFISLCLQIKDVTGYSISYIRTIFMYIGIIFTCGLLRLVFRWFPHWMLMCMNKKCALIKAEKILVKVIVCPRFFRLHEPRTKYELRIKFLLQDVHGVRYIHDVVVEIIGTAK